MKRGVLFLLSVFLLAAIARADLLVTEIMYNPDQADDTDAEWIEIYNTGNTADLSNWQLNGRSLEGTLESGKYLVIAKELVDGSDSDTESFESIWGNNDGVWDEQDGFLAIDGAFTLGNTADSVNLSNDAFSDFIGYSDDLGADGNGHTLERINLSENFWNESLSVGGTPGMKNSLSVDLEDNKVLLELNVLNALPAINVSLGPDDMDEDGVQIVANGTRTVYIMAVIDDDNGADDILNVSAAIEDQVVMLSRIEENGTVAVFEGSFVMEPDAEKKTYPIAVTAFDSLANSTAVAEFEFIGVVATVLETTSLSFDLEPGSVSEEKVIAIRNNGTASVLVNLSVTDIGEIPKENIEAFINNDWNALESIGFELMPGARQEVAIRVKVPNIKAQSFEGRVRVNAKPL
jgi:hypothetical protein